MKRGDKIFIFSLIFIFFISFASAGFFSDFFGKTTGDLIDESEGFCGNGILESGETCDDGNTANGDGCSSTCQIESGGPVCGNGILESGEVCDYAATDEINNPYGDSCHSSCGVDGTSGGWKGCRGTGVSVCLEHEKVTEQYYIDNPLCVKNTNCQGLFFTCNADFCPEPEETTCTDSDGPKNFYEKGEVYGELSDDKGTRVDLWIDYCTNNNYVYDFTCEFYVDENAPKINAWADLFYCPNGCVDGACTISPGQYPSPFVLGGLADVAIIYGTAPALSILELIEAGNIKSNLQQYTKTEISLIKDGELDSVSSKNLIVVGSVGGFVNCTNSVISKIVGEGDCNSAKKELGIGPGQFLIQSFENPWQKGKIVLLVVGYDLFEVVEASKYLRNNPVKTSVGSRYVGGSKSSCTGDSCKLYEGEIISHNGHDFSIDFISNTEVALLVDGKRTKVLAELESIVIGDLTIRIPAGGINFNEGFVKFFLTVGDVAECTETDGGVNIYWTGRIEYYVEDPQGIMTGIHVSEDKCVDKTTLTEFSCEYYDPIEVGPSKKFNCPNGCQDGACFKQKIVSILGDSDNYFPKQNINLIIKTLEDDGTTITKEEGWHIQYYTYLVNSSDGYLKEYISSGNYNAEYSEIGGSHWIVDYWAPSDPGEYYTKITLYCASENSACWEATGGYALEWKEFIYFEVEGKTSSICIDSDEGINIYKAGRVNINDIEILDSCEFSDFSDGILREAFCSPSGKASYVSVICPSETPYCNNAICSSEPPQCTDTDGGKNIYVKGTTSEGVITSSDICLLIGPTWYVQESYCLDDGFAEELIPCPNGCVDGACKKILNESETIIIEERFILDIDSLRRTARAAIKARTIGREKISFNDDGNYEIEIRKEARLLAVVPVEEPVTLILDIETGNVLSQKNVWWGFLALDVEKSEEEVNLELENLIAVSLTLDKNPALNKPFIVDTLVSTRGDVKDIKWSVSRGCAIEEVTSGERTGSFTSYSNSVICITTGDKLVGVIATGANGQTARDFEKIVVLGNFN